MVDHQHVGGALAGAVDGEMDGVEGVVLVLGDGHAAQAGAREDDAARGAARCAQQRHELLRHDGVREDVEVEDFVVLGPQTGFFVGGEGGAGVVDQDVQVPEFRLYGCNSRVDGGVRGHVQLDGLEPVFCFWLGGEDLRHGVEAFLPVARPEEYVVGAGFGELLTGVPAEALVGTGNEDDTERRHVDTLGRRSVLFFLGGGLSELDCSIKSWCFWNDKTA